MYSSVYAFISVVWLYSGSGQAELAQPMNLTMITINTQFNLSWSQDLGQTIGPKVSFTVQYIPKYKWGSGNSQWVTVCQNTLDTWCDLTPSNLYFLGLYMLRLRANRGGLHSRWVIMEFCPDKDAALGPPSRVDVAPAGHLLDVRIWDPRTSTNGSMKELHTQMYYRVVYWEHSDTRLEHRALESSKCTVASQLGQLKINPTFYAKSNFLFPHLGPKRHLRGLEEHLSPDTMTVDTHVNILTLPDLQPWTWYCVSVQSRYDFYSKTSAYTTPHCLQTEGVVPWWQILLIFIFSGLVGFVGLLVLISVGFYCYRTVKYTLYPSVQLPAHFQAYLSDLSPGSDAPRLITPDSESELNCDRFSVCPQVVPLEIHMPVTVPSSDLEPDGRHNRQDSGSSEDSGVYSTEGGSAPPRHCSSGPSSAATKGPRQGGSSAHLEQVKMEHMGLEQVKMEHMGLEQVKMEHMGLEQVKMEHMGLEPEAVALSRTTDEGIMDMGV